MRPRCRRSLPTRRRRLPPSRHPTARTHKPRRTTVRSISRSSNSNRCSSRHRIRKRSSSLSSSLSSSSSRTLTSDTRPVRCNKATQARRPLLRCRLRCRPTPFHCPKFRPGSKVLPTSLEPRVSSLSHLRRVRSRDNSRTRPSRLRLRRRRRLPLPMASRLLRPRRTPASRLLPARSTRRE